MSQNKVFVVGVGMTKFIKPVYIINIYIYNIFY